MVPALCVCGSQWRPVATDPSQLKPYIRNVKTGDDVLQRYQVMTAGNAGDLRPGDVTIAEKAPVDEQNDTLFEFGYGTWSWHGVGTNSAAKGSGGVDRLPTTEK